MATAIGRLVFVEILLC
jgi:hypothetical protein